MSKTKEKYMNALLYACAQPEFNSREFAKTFKISHNVITAMNELGMIHKFRHGYYRWVLSRQPLASDVVAIRKRLTAYNAIAKQPSPQLTIKPLKRVASLVEPPVQSIDLHEESQLTWIHLIIIFAAGLIAGGLIATIWK
jgi:hypothetical protein